MATINWSNNWSKQNPPKILALSTTEWPFAYFPNFQIGLQVFLVVCRFLSAWRCWRDVGWMTILAAILLATNPSHPRALRGSHNPVIPIVCILQIMYSKTQARQVRTQAHQAELAVCDSLSIVPPLIDSFFSLLFGGFCYGTDRSEETRYSRTTYFLRSTLKLAVYPVWLRLPYCTPRLYVPCDAAALESLHFQIASTTRHICCGFATGMLSFRC